METGLQTNDRRTSTTLQQISQNVIAQVKNIVNGQYANASSLMPRKIEDVFDQPKIRELSAGIGRKPVLAQVEFELIQLASLMSVGGNLNKAQVPFIALNLCIENPLESIADFKICFSRGAMGHYGEIQRLDGITINGWMSKYREEKYLLMEDMLMKEKENIYKVPELTDAERENINSLDVSAMLKEYEESIKSFESKAILPMSEEDIKAEGQEKPKREVYLYDATEAGIKLREVHNRLFAAQEKIVRERHPDWSEDEIEKNCKELREYTIHQDTKPKWSSHLGKIWEAKKKKKV